MAYGWDLVSSLPGFWSFGGIRATTTERNAREMEVAAGLEPAKTGFADQRLDHFGIATKSCTQFIPKSIPKMPPQRLFTPIWVRVTY